MNRSDEQLSRLAAEHPCFSVEGAGACARMHLAVAPRCNIQCNYCNRRYDCPNESRPGVASSLLSPEEALERVRFVSARLPQLKVVGVAGPGDPLASAERTLRTLNLVRREFPRLQLCLSTNGLDLPVLTPHLSELKVRHVTITINAVDPDVGARVYSWVRRGNRIFRGREGAGILIESQLAGLSKLRSQGTLVKVNMVMVPGINDHHLPEVARKVTGLGAFIVNVMPLIPIEGTPFAVIAPPAEQDVDRVRTSCGADVRQMRHCQRCRADAVGFLNRSEPGFLDNHPADCAQSRSKTVRVAVASRDGRVVNLHFGHAREFHIFEVGLQYCRPVEIRRTDRYCRGSEECDDAETKLAETIEMLKDCRYLFCSRIGESPARRLLASGIEPVTAYDYIEEAVRSVVRVESDMVAATS